jgi:hypothetical protein
MTETLQLNLAMNKRAYCKVTRFSDQEMVTSIIDNFCDLMMNTEFPNTAEKIFQVFSELLITVCRDRDNGLDIDLDCFLDQIVDVFKHHDGPKETLQAALMAVNIPNAKYRQEPRARNGSGGAQGNTRHVETAVHSPTKQESKVIGMVLKALNDLKSDMGTVKNIIQDLEYL